MTTRASSDIIDQIKAEQSRDEPCSTHGIFAYGRGAGRQALCRGVGTKWLGNGPISPPKYCFIRNGPVPNRVKLTGICHAGLWGFSEAL